MSDKYTKVYISMPHDFLCQLDQLAKGEHQSRSAVIREAVKLYMEWRSAPPSNRFFTMTDALRKNFETMSDKELEERIDQAIAKARNHDR